MEKGLFQTCSSTPLRQQAPSLVHFAVNLFYYYSFFLSINSSPLADLLRNVLAKEGIEVVHLAQGDALLAQDVVGGREVKVEGRGDVAGVVDESHHLGRLATAQTHGELLARASVDGLLGALLESSAGDVDAGVKVGKGLEVALIDGGLFAAKAGGGLDAQVGDNVDLDRERKHVLVDAGVGERGRVGSSLTLLEDGGQAVENLESLANGDVVEAHG